MGFQQGLSGLSAAAANLDVIGNNVANSSTVGFKQSQAQFADVYSSALSGAGGSQVGIGVKVAAVVQQFTQGKITATQNPLDIAINGNGFFRLSNSDGSISYSRNGQFQVDSDGYIISSTNKRLTGYPATASGALDFSAPQDLVLSTADRSPQVTSEINALLNLDSRQSVIATPFDLTDPTTYNHSTAVSVYDSLGNAHALSTFYRKTAAGDWDVYASLDGNQIGAGAVGALHFGGDGLIDTALTTLPFTLSAPVTTGATSPMTFDLGFSGTTQFGSSFSVNALDQDGFASGRLTGFNISNDGTILGRYTNGRSAVLGQIVIAGFANPQGLEAQGDNAYAESASSGAPLVGTPGTGTLGVLQSSAIEDSNVDLTAELVNMITAQRVYQANAQTIKTQDQVLQTLVNLR